MSNINEKAKRVVLAFGEVTGHAHAFYGDDTVEFDGKQLRVKARDSLRHEEHGEHIIAPLSPTQPAIGDVTIQREYHMKEIKRVAD